MKTNITKEQLMSICEGNIADAQEAKKAFADGIQNKDPVHFFSWHAASMIASCCMAEISQEVKQALENDRTPQQIADYLSAELIKEVSMGSNSTSTMHNLANHTKAQAKAKFLDNISSARYLAR